MRNVYAGPAASGRRRQWGSSSIFRQQPSEGLNVLASLRQLAGKARLRWKHFCYLFITSGS